MECGRRGELLTATAAAPAIRLPYSVAYMSPRSDTGLPDAAHVVSCTRDGKNLVIFKSRASLSQ